MSLNVHGFVDEDSRRAAEIFFPAQKAVMDQLGRERGWGPQSRPRAKGGKPAARRDASVEKWRSWSVPLAQAPVGAMSAVLP